MKNNKIYLVGFILLLYFNFVLQGTNISINEQDDKDVVTPLIVSNSVGYEWFRTWGGDSGEVGRSIAIDSNNNVIVVGTESSFGAGNADIVVVKYNNDGIQLWNRTWGGVDWDYGEGVAVDSLSNIYVAGDTDSFGAGFSDMVLVKYNSTGVQQWNRTWGGGSDDEGGGVAVDSSGNVYFTGSTDSFGAGYYDFDMVLVKYNSAGVQQWNRTWGGVDRDDGRGVAVDSLSNIYVAGNTGSFGAGYYDMVLVKYNSAGVQQWNRTWGGVDWDYGGGVVVDSPSNIYVAGDTRSFGAGFADMVLVKYNSAGVQQWNRTWGGGSNDFGQGAVVDSSSNIYVAGDTESFGAGCSDMVLVKYNSTGVQQWNRTWGGVDWDYGEGVVVDSPSNIYVAGTTRSFGAGHFDIVLVKFVVSERPPSDTVVMIIIIIMSIIAVASAVGVGIAITFFIRKRRNIV